MTLIPSNASPLDLALETANDTYARLAPKVLKIARIGRSETPADWLPWVVVAKGLEDIVPYVRDMEMALSEGPAWLRVRGTTPAIEIGIRWVESAGTVAEADGRHPWFKFQVSYPAPPTDLHQVQQLVGIINLSKSAWDELFRLYSPDYDHRPVRMDQHRADSGGWFDGYSGAPRWDGGPLISFGSTGTIVFDLEPASGTGIVFEALSASDRLADGTRYDVDRFGVRPLSICDAAGETDMRSAAPIQTETAVSVGIYFTDAADIAAAYSNDTWPDVYAAGARWQDTTGGFSIPLSPEAS